MIPLPPHVEPVPGFAELGILAFTTTRQFGSLGTATDEAVRAVMQRWSEIREHLSSHGIDRLATAGQVHGRRVIVHGTEWTGWLRGEEADGHVAAAGSNTAVSVTVADCVPVFLAHPSGAVALLHSGWRGTEQRIVAAGLDALNSLGCPPAEVRVHLGPAICGACYEVGADVYTRLTGQRADRPTRVDLRALIATHARAHGVQQVTISECCTRCDNARFYSHRAGDVGRQISLIATRSPHPA